MIAPTVVREIELLLAAGRMSQRKIAKHVGVGRAAVSTIALGERPDYEAIRQPKFAAPTGPLVRCPGCGGKVRMPCVQCRILAVKELARAKAQGIA